MNKHSKSLFEINEAVYFLLLLIIENGYYIIRISHFLKIDFPFQSLNEFWTYIINIKLFFLSQAADANSVDLKTKDEAIEVTQKKKRMKSVKRLNNGALGMRKMQGWWLIVFLGAMV